MELPAEADGARDASPSPGQPRGTQDQFSTTPTETRRAPRARPRRGTVGSAGSSVHPPAPLDAIAVVLADAFLAAAGSAAAGSPAAAGPTDAWTAPVLTAAGFDAVGVERAFVGLAAAVALAQFPRAPHDAPRALAAAIGGDPRVTALWRRRLRSDRPLRILQRSVSPVRASRSIDGLLAVDTLPELARALDLTVGRLLWLADTRTWNRLAPEGSPLHNYSFEWIQRPGRTPRLIEKPKALLRRAQRTILDDLLAHLPVHDAAHGFVPGRSAVTGAAEHVGRHVVIGADLVSFFDSVGAGTVYGVFRNAGLAEPVAHVLTGVCTNVVPAAVLNAMPPGGSLDERFALRQALRVPHLPQGAPSSPALANVSLRRLDARLAGLARAAAATYTRYADDLAFSGDDELASRVDPFLRSVDRIVRAEGHELNRRKTRVRRRGVRQSVTGLVVNDRVATGRREYDALRAILHNCSVHGPDSQNRQAHPDFRAVLEGRVAWAAHAHPARGERLRRMLAEIDWRPRT